MRMIRLCRHLAIAGAVAAHAVWAQAAWAQAPAAQPVLAQSNSAVRAHADSAILNFFESWREAWWDTRSEAPAFPEDAFLTPEQRARFEALHCHPVMPPASVLDRIIRSSVLAQATCPTWLPEDIGPVDDERRSIDNAVRPSLRLRLKVARYALRSVLDTAAAQLGGDLTLARQRVRFALDAGDVRGAWSAIACNGAPAECELMRGLVLYRAGAAAAADSTFLSAAGLMSAPARCTWNDIRLLLDRQSQKRYDAMSCAARTAFETRFWWLADPLYLEDGNERRAEHFARKVQLSLLASLGEMDERQHWTLSKGGDAVAEALLRYGWPTRMYWAGFATDREHGKWMIARQIDLAPPYVLREYSRDRLHVVPDAEVLQSPFDAKPSGWALDAPGTNRDAWPVEHYGRDRSRIVQLPAGQIAMFRRARTTRFAWATGLDGKALGRARGDTASAVLFESRVEPEMWIAGAFTGRADASLVVDVLLKPGRALLGVELPGDSVRAAARTRFAMNIEAPLADLRGAKALSQPMLFEPPRDASVVLNDDAAIARMLGSTELVKPRRVGIYWESYGFTESDTLDIEVRVAREERAGFLTNVVGIFGIGRQEGGRVAPRWRDSPENRTAAMTREGNVIVQHRSIVLEMSQLPAGHYRLEVHTTRPGERTISAAREFDIRR